MWQRAPGAGVFMGTRLRDPEPDPSAKSKRRGPNFLLTLVHMDDCIAWYS